MKHFLLLVSLLAALGRVAAPCLAQSLDERIRDIYSQLDKSAVQSGILIHQTPLFVWPGRYDGVNVADSMELGIDQFGILYGQFRGAAVGQPELPEPGIYLSRALRQHKPGDTIGLALLAMRYDYIRANAQDANLLQWSNGKMLDVPGRTQSPYGQQLCFAFTALQQHVQGLTIHFSLPAELLFNNLGWNIESAAVDFGDGQGWRVLPAGGVTTVTYPEAGRKRIVAQYSRDGNTYQAATFVDVQESLAERFGGPENGVPYDKNSPEVVQLSGLTLSIFSACEDKKVRRPLIVVEGFGGFNTPATMFDLLQENTSSNEKLEDWLNLREYDLIWVDYAQPFAPIQTNANFLIGAIEWINARKHADGSSEPNVLIGASMGGLVSKVALLKMHNQQNKDSEVDKFFSYDSPLKGANYPIGIQTFIRDLIYNAANIGASTASFQGALDLLDSPAARDMLATRVTQGPPACNGCPITFSAGPSAEFTALQTAIGQLEAIRPISAIARHIVLSNGANMGVLQENIAVPTMQILKLHIELEEIAGAGVWQGCYDVIIDAKAYAATNQSTLIYERSITVDISLLCDPFANNSTQAVSFVLPAPLNLDNAPGGTTNLGLQQLDDGMAALIEALDHVEDSEHAVLINSFSFIHTVSSLDMPAGTNPNTPTPNGGASVSRWTASNDASEVSPFSGLPEFNQQHVSINTRIADVIADELEPLSVPALGTALQSGQIYNFGRSTPINVSGPTETPRVIAQNLTVQAGAELWLNRNDRIGFTNALNPFNNKPQQFVVSVPGAACESDDFVTVATENGGKIILGEYDNGVANIGQLRFGKNSELIVEGAEGVRIDKRSTLAIEGGATMSIHTGGKVTTSDLANVFVQNGSQLTIQNGGALELNWGSRCIVRQNSRIIVESGGILQISHPNTNVTVQSGGEIILRPGAILRLWDGQQDDGEAYLKIEGGGKLRIEGEFDLSGNGYIWMQAWPTPGYPIYEDLRPEIKYKGHSKTCRLFRLDYTNLPAVNKPLRLEKLEVHLSAASVYSENGPVRVFDVNFQNNGVSATGLDVRQGSFLYVRNADFIGLGYGMEVSNHQGIAGVMPRIQDSRFTDCWRGLGMFECRYLYLVNDEFLRSPIELWGVSNFAGMYGTTVTGSGNVDEIAGDDDDDLINEWPESGVFLWDVPRFRMSGGVVQDYQAGIFIPADSKSNVILTNKATVQNNRVGVQVQKGFRDISGNTVQNYGSILMDCARMLDNKIGVFGSNALLLIDAYVNSGTKDPAFVRSNHFRVQPNGNFIRSLFYVCYDANGYNISTVSAKGNYWEGVDNLGYDPWRLYNSALDPAPPFGCYIASNANNVTLIRQPVALNEPLTCPVQPPNPPSTPPQPEGDAFACEAPPGSSLEVKLYEQFYAGYRQFTQEVESESSDFTLSNALFQPLADIGQGDLNTLGVECRQFTEGARTFVRGTVESGLGGRPWDEKTSRTTDGNAPGGLHLQPNPASGLVMITLPSPDLKIRVWNAVGNLMAERTEGSVYQYLDVGDWPSGMYLVEAVDLDKMTVQRVKLVVD